jgi:hypothetical protein
MESKYGSVSRGRVAGRAPARKIGGARVSGRKSPTKKYVRARSELLKGSESKRTAAVRTAAVRTVAVGTAEVKADVESLWLELGLSMDQVAAMKEALKSDVMQKKRMLRGVHRVCLYVPIGS